MSSFVACLRLATLVVCLCALSCSAEVSSPTPAAVAVVGSATSSPACCAVFDPSVMQASTLICSCYYEQPEGECTQAFWDGMYSERRPAPALVDRCPDVAPTVTEVWCCAEYASDARYPDERDACQCYLESETACEGMVKALWGAVRVPECGVTEVSR